MVLLWVGQSSLSPPMAKILLGRETILNSYQIQVKRWEEKGKKMSILSRGPGF